MYDMEDGKGNQEWFSPERKRLLFSGEYEGICQTAIRYRRERSKTVFSEEGSRGSGFGEDMKRNRIIALLMAVGLFCLLAAPALAATYATVQGGWLRLRSNPSYDATVISSYRNGTVVTVLSQENGWARVLTPDYRIGYMDARYLYMGTYPTAVPTVQPPSRTWTEVNRTAWVTSSNGKGVRLRSSPEVTKTNVLGLYPVGRTVTEIRVSSDGWSYIKIDGKHGYMMSSYLTTGVVGPVYPPTVTKTPTPFVPSDPSKPYTTYIPIPTEVPAVTATPTPTPTPVPTATPEPKAITSIKLDPYVPSVGDTLKVIVNPTDAEYSAVWYRDDNILLSTSKTYKVQEGDVGHQIYVRVQGVGQYAGFAADGSTTAVQK